MTAHYSSAQIEMLAKRLNSTVDATPGILSTVVADTARRTSVPSEAANVVRMERLIGADALVDAAFVLIELELPQWKLRRICYDGGEWHCALSKQRELPDWLDEAAEAKHASLVFAVLGAYLETFRKIERFHKPRMSAPRSAPSAYRAVSFIA